MDAKTSQNYRVIKAGQHEKIGNTSVCCQTCKNCDIQYGEPTVVKTTKGKTTTWKVLSQSCTIGKFVCTAFGVCDKYVIGD